MSVPGRTLAGSGKARRSYGTGALYEKVDSTGRIAWYGKWRRDGVQVKRRIGEKRTDGSREGLTRVQAEGELRRLIAEVKPARVSGDALRSPSLAAATKPTCSARAARRPPSSPSTASSGYGSCRSSLNVTCAGSRRRIFTTSW